MEFFLTYILPPLAAGVVLGFAGFAAGIKYRKKIAEAQIGSAESQAAKIVNDAVKAAEAKKKEYLIEGKEEIQRSRTELEQETRERRSELQRQERRLSQKEEQLDRKYDTLEKKEEQVAARLKQADALNEEIAEIKRKQIDTLQQVAGMSTEEAKALLLERIKDEAEHDAAVIISENERRIKDDAEEKARYYVSMAIQRCAADQVSEAAVSTVSIPNDEMKGRLIGREGRNIRTFETVTGVDLIIDDTPEAITLSAFDPVRREIARIALEKLIADGRIHPARIEEMVEKARKEVDASIKKAAEDALLELGIHGLPHDLVMILGRLRYRTSYGQNVLRHSVEVAHLAGMMASELGLDAKLARRAGLLHDIGKAIDHETEGTHIQIGVDLARKFRENKDVVHAIEAHHNDVEPHTTVAVLIQAADAISAARPGARRENLENYIKRLEKLEELANSFEGVERSFAVQAGREIRIIVNPQAVSDDRMVLMSHEIVKKIEDELDYPGQIKINLIRENRVVNYAK